LRRQRLRRAGGTHDPEAASVFENQAVDVGDAGAAGIAMPVMGGEEALARIQAIRADVPVIVSSGYGETEAARRFAGIKPAGFLQKPYTVNQLMEAIAVVLGRL